MIVVIGGAFQGKLEFAVELACGKDHFVGRDREVTVADGRTDSCEQAFVCSVVNHFEEYVRRFCMEKGENKDRTERAVQEFLQQLGQQNPEVILVAAEVGCGIVPMDAGERVWREAAGRASILAAKQSEAVYRVICGIGARIK